MSFQKFLPDEVARMVKNGDVIGFSGFTGAGAAKAIPQAIARRAQQEHEAGRALRVGVISGASTGPSLDGVLAKADAISFRTPYQSDPDLRRRINSGRTHFFDMHLSMLPQTVRAGVLGRMNWAVVEACDLSPDGKIVLTSSVGATPTFCRVADKILIELNRAHPPSLHGLHDIYEPLDPPYRREIAIYAASDRIGSPVVEVDPKKIVGVVETNLPDETPPFDAATKITQRIGENVVEFLVREIAAGRLPTGLLPLQSGVGNIANAALAALGAHPEMPNFEMYSEVLQDSVIELIYREKIRFASGVSLTLSRDVLETVYENLAFFKRHLVLRPQEITNHPEVIRRLGIISLNTALEIDISGNINSTHAFGTRMMNGIGGSGDFTRNASLSMFACPSTAKDGKVSTIVPLVAHMDHSEHSVQVVITEHGVADLRRKDPRERAQTIIECCAHPDFRADLLHYCAICQDGHEPQSLELAFGMHRQFLATGDMRGGDWLRRAR